MKKYLLILGLGLLAVLAYLLATLLFKGDLPKEVVDANYSSPASQFMDLGEQGRIHFRDEGNQRGLPVLLLHGSNASLHTFEPWVQLLKDDYRMVSLDLPGHGLTGEVPNEKYSTTAYVSLVDRVASQLGIDKFALVGSSMGGDAALRYALAHPQKLLGLVLVGSGGLRVEAPDGGELEPPLVFKLLQQSWFRGIAAKLDFHFLIEQGVRSAYNNSQVVTDKLIQRYYNLNLRAGTRRATVLRFQGPWTFLQEDDIASIKVPTLLMWGVEDALVPFAAAQRFKELLPQAETAFYGDVGHMPMEEIPEPSADDLRHFLQKLGR